MTTHSPMPDVEAVVIAALRSANVCSGRVYSAVPVTPTWPLATVKRLGGTPTERHRIDSARIQIDVFSDIGDKATARDEADAARIAAHELEGTTSSSLNAAITAVDDELGLTWLPDPDTGRPRYVFAVTVTAHDFQG